MTATTEAQLLARTLTASIDVTGGEIAAALEPGGGRSLQGDLALAECFADAIIAAGTRAGTLTPAFAWLGLPSTITVAFGDTLIAVAATLPDRFGPESASLLALVVAHAYAGRERLHELAQLARRADSDPLTGLRHHRPFEERLGASRPGQTAVLAVDVDQFKHINDRYGHRAGDVALVCLADALRSVLRDSDDLYRIGGDEFAAVVDVNGPAEVINITRRLLEAARRAGHTISVGAAMRVASETGRETLHRADTALYQAKRAGRDTARLAA